MTDLKELADALDYVSPICNKLHNTEWRHEMARRLREQEQKIADLVKLYDVTYPKIQQAESALLACQAREGELREALRKTHNSVILLRIKGGEDQITSILDDIDSILSHSTGSKIMAVVEAVRKHYELPPRDCDCNFCEAYRALEDK